jgi:ABC-type dipeptide/oligopeptide/nickel transport system permease subunit
LSHAGLPCCVPALAIGFTLLAFSFICDGLRAALDPRMRK